MQHKPKSAFTLMEMLIVIIIIGIIAGIGFPGYFKTKEYILGKEAIVTLKLIGAAEKIYRMESTNNLYVSCTCKGTGTDVDGCNNADTGCNTLLKLAIPFKNWEYEVNADVADPKFTAIASRVGTGGPGGYLDCEYTLKNDDAEPSASVDCP